MNCIITIGISGCGKTTFVNEHYPNYVRLELDDIRRELTHDVSDQSQNARVMDVFNERLQNAIDNNDDVAISNTNLKRNYVQLLLNKLPDNTNVTFVMFECSRAWKVCRERVMNDANDRARTDVVEKNGMPLHFWMHLEYATISTQMNRIAKDNARLNINTIWIQ